MSEDCGRCSESPGEAAGRAVTGSRSACYLRHSHGSGVGLSPGASQQ